MPRLSRPAAPRRGAFRSRRGRRARFEREARTISTLNHPHICTLYDVGSTGSLQAAEPGLSYLVMEHLEGETLEARLREGPLPLEQVLDLGAQIADALSAAHKHGIVHRDLKPANVMLSKAGAKLLDFGLAKLRPQEDMRLERDSSATVTQGHDVTAAGKSVSGRSRRTPRQRGVQSEAAGAALHRVALTKPNDRFTIST
jgi:serine/threonine protein kinase